MKKTTWMGVALASLVALAGCSNQATTESTTPTTNGEGIKVVTTFYPMYEFTKEVVGDEGDVSLLIQAGTEAHGYEPSAKDIATVTEADVFVYDNENMETWVPSLLESIQGDSDVTVIKATGDMLLMGGSDHSHDHDHEHEEEGHTHELDPHVWLAPNLAIELVTNIRDELIAAYPDKKAAFESNAAEYIKELEALNEEYKTTLSNAKQKSFVTQHEAFGYLALEYGLNQVSITGISADEEPTPARLAELKSYIETNQIKYIYFEENASKEVAETLAKETGVQLEVLNPIESLTQEQMDSGETYITVMRKNLEALTKTTSQEGPAVQAEDGGASKKTVYNGYFEDSEIQDRALTDWEGEWQSVYPFLLDGTLDPVFEYKSKRNPDMTAQEYKDYYTIGYKTDVSNINITATTMEFIVDGKSHKYEYQYVGKEVLTYTKGNRGVRYLFETSDPNAGNYKYVQFSDHSISPTDAEHFHIYFGGESHEALLNELENWPTYYPSNLNALEIAQEMLAH